MEKKKREPKHEEVYDVNYFWEIFDIKHDPADLGLKTGKRKKKVPKALYKKVILRYFDIYARDVYFNNNTQYFLLGGNLTLCSTPESVMYRKDKNGVFGYHKKNKSLFLVWWGRLSVMFHESVKFEKLIGQVTRVHKIEKIFRQIRSIELLPKFDDIMKEKFKNRLIYRR